MQNELFHCDNCGCELTKDTVYHFDGSYFCSECLDDSTCICEHCGDRIWADENSGTDSFVLCECCYDNHYTTCESCGRIIHMFDELMTISNNKKENGNEGAVAPTRCGVECDDNIAVSSTDSFDAICQSLEDGMAAFEASGEACVAKEDEFDCEGDDNIAASGEDSFDVICQSLEDGMAGFETAGEPCVDREDDFDRVDDYDIAASDEDSLDTMCLSYEDSITAFETSDEECADIEDDSDREEKILDQFDDEELATASTAYIYSLLGSSSSSGGESASENGDIRNSSDPEIADSNPADLYNGGPLYRESSAALQPDENTTAYAIAQDMIGKCDFVLIGSGVYCFNGIVHELLDDITLGRLILKHERMYVEAIGKVAIISNIRDFIKLEERLVLDTHEISDAYIVFRNGRYNMKKRRFEKNKANNFQTSYLDFDYDEGACGCKWFIQYLEVLTGGNDGLKILVLEVMGYIFSNNMSAKKVFFAVGPGDTGKSLFLKLVASFFPAKYVSNIDLCKFDDKFTSGSLVDMRLNIGGDLPNKVLSPDVIQIVKEITGGDKMQARKMYQQSFPYITTCKLLFATNHNINMKYNDEQFVERSVILPFMNKVPKDKQIRDLIEKLKPERAAIFNMALQAYFRLEKNNFVFSEVVNSADFVRGTCVTHEEVSYADSAIRQFVDASCEVSDSAEAFETVADLHAAFSKFYAEKYNLNIDKDAFSKAFKQYAQDMGLEYKQKNKGRGYIGIKLIK